MAELNPEPNLQQNEEPKQLVISKKIELFRQALKEI